MASERTPISASRLPVFLPWLILAVTLALTWLVWDHERQLARKELRTQFDFVLRETVSRVEQRVAGYEQMLRGVQGLFATTALTNRRALCDYVETLQLDANFSAIQVIGVIEQVPLASKSAHEARMQQLGFTGYAIHPEGEREVYAPIIQREPDAGGKHSILGLDPWADPARRVAMEAARDSGMAAITGKVRLAIDRRQEAQPGFIMYLPIFAHGQPRDSVAQRRANLIGWVYASFYMDEFMAGLYGKQAPGITLAIYDEANPVEAALMYRTGNSSDKGLPAIESLLSANEYMVVAGHTWTLSLSTQREFEAWYGRDVSSVIAVTGAGLGVALALLAWLMVTGRARALRMAAEMTEELRHMAQHDPLTGLPNRALFSDRLHKELARAKRHDGQFALVFLDLDHFKPINDNYGHAIGDLVLQQVALRLKDTVRESDTVGRIGGDEFVVLVPELAESDAALSLAEKIRQVIRQPFALDGRQLDISCSLGVAIYPDDGIDEISLTKRADEAMYRAKDDGRDSVRRAS
uniref:GGDEF protein n=1 Tax=Dechloromonas aromatica (strain RCB) TaxID=159087 RepID=Q478M9_DECAR